jgi:hypothetical protein
MYRNKCLICSTTNRFNKILDFGFTPWSNNFLKKKKKNKTYPLTLVRCRDCLTVQLNFFVKKETMFLNHNYISGVNSELKIHFKKIVNNNLIKKFNSGNILDIGSNDSSFLKNFPKKYKKIGFEPCKKVIKKNKNIITINKFFSYEEAKKIKIKFDIIHASGVFFHLEQLHSVTKGVKYLLKSEGIFVIQFLNLKDIIEKFHFDQIYHEHLVYYTLKSLSVILNLYELEIFDAFKVKIHGGSLIVYVSHKGLKNKTKRYKILLKQESYFLKNFNKKILIFKKNVLTTKKRINKFVSLNKKKNNRIIGIGAPAKAITLLKVCNLMKNKIDFCLEINKKKFNTYLPNTDIIVKDQRSFKIKKNDCFILFSWNFKKSILGKLFKNYVKKITIINPHIHE